MNFLKKSPRWLPYFSLLFGVLIAYSNLYNNSFLYDDIMLIVQNQLIRDWHLSIFTTSIMEGVDISSSFYRPLQILLFTIIFKIFGLSLLVFHLLNVILHASNSCLIYKLGRKLNFNPRAVFLAAMLWAVHPMNCEAVAWISAVPEPLYVFFCLTSLNYLVPDFNFKKCIIIGPLVILGLLSKETAVVFPLLAICCIYLTPKKRYFLESYLRTAPLCITVLLYLIFRFAVLNVSHSLPGDDLYTNHITVRFATFLATLPSYLKLMLWPINLHADYEFPIYPDFIDFHVIGGALILSAVVALLIYGKSIKNLPLRWGCLWFFAAFSVYAGVLMPINGRFMEHWMYLPSIGLFLGITESLFLYTAKKRTLYLRKWIEPTYITAICIFVILTFLQNNLWRDEITMYSNSLRYNPRSVRVHNNLGIAYSEQEKYGDAISEFRKAIEISDQSLLAHYNLALALLLAPDNLIHREEAISELKHTIKLDPYFYPAYESLANSYREMGDAKEADSYKEKAESLKQKGRLNITPP